jgi:hypothetical protein
VVKGRACEYQTVHKGDGDAGRHSFFQFPQHVARGRAVEIQLVFFSAVEGRDHVRLVIDLKAYMGKETGVEDGINGSEFM